jgi:iron complex outermembrane recepter protein
VEVLIRKCLLRFSRKNLIDVLLVENHSQQAQLTPCYMQSLKLFVVLILMGVFASNLLAQDSNKNPKKEVQTKMPEVLVTGASEKRTEVTTGTKTSTPLKDIPASIQIIPEKVIKDQGAVALDNTIQNVSGVTQSSSSNYGFFNNYLIRGLNLTFLRDGVPDGPTINGYARTLINVGRIEVLKGPGSALYGTSAPGGTINLITKAPQSSSSYTLSQVFGSFGTYQTAVDLTGPLQGKDLLYRFNADYYTTDGFRDLSRNYREVLPAVMWRHTPDHEMIFDFDYRELEVTADTYGIPFSGRNLITVSRENKYYTPFGTTEQNIFRGSVRDEWRLGDNLVIHNNLAVMHRRVFLMRNAGGTVAANAITMTGRGLRRQSDDSTDLTYQLEPVFEFETSDIHHTMLCGFELQAHELETKRDTATLPNITNVFAPIVPETSLGALTFTPNFNRSVEANYHSLYAQDQIEFNEQWKMRLGGRVDRYETYDLNRTGGAADRNRFDTELSGQAGLVFQPTSTTSFYGGASKSSLAIFSSETANTAVAPENATQYEVGNKSSFFNDKLRINTALFQVIRENFLVTIGVDQVPVGEQKTQGIEIDLSSEPIKGWNLRGNYSIVEAELTKLTSDVSAERNRPTGVPTQSASAWTTYEIQGGALKGLGFGGGATFKDSIFIDQRNTQTVPSYLTGDLVAFYRQDAFEIQLNVYNISDETYFRNGVNGGALPGDPISVQGTIKVRF